jgi:signal transduction histidine kinase
MARRKLTLKEQLKGVRAAVRSKRTPPQLREGLRKRARWLIAQIRQGRPGKKKRPFSSRGTRTNQ